MSSNAADIRVCFAGDTLVAGTGDATALGWVGRVAAAGITSGLNLTSFNLGVRGATSVQVVRRLATEARPRLTVAEDPRIVLPEVSDAWRRTVHEGDGFHPDARRVGVTAPTLAWLAS